MVLLEIKKEKGYNNGMSLGLKIAFLVILWIGTLWGYFRWKFKNEKDVLPPDRGYDPNHPEQ